jgi:hypothetical protein
MDIRVELKALEIAERVLQDSVLWTIEALRSKLYLGD